MPTVVLNSFFTFHYQLNQLFQFLTPRRFTFENSHGSFMKYQRWAVRRQVQQIANVKTLKNSLYFPDVGYVDPKFLRFALKLPQIIFLLTNTIYLKLKGQTRG